MVSHLRMKQCLSQLANASKKLLYYSRTLLQELESFNNFMVFSADVYTGELIPDNEIGDNVWQTEK